MAAWISPLLGFPTLQNHWQWHCWARSERNDRWDPQASLGISWQLPHSPSISDPLVNVNKKLWKNPPFCVGKSTINGNFSIAMLNYQRVYPRIKHEAKTYSQKTCLDQHFWTHITNQFYRCFIQKTPHSWCFLAFVCVFNVKIRQNLVGGFNHLEKH